MYVQICLDVKMYIACECVHYGYDRLSFLLMHDPISKM